MLKHLSTSYYWGEPERAPHRRVECSQSIYVWYIYYGTSVTRAPLYVTYTPCAIYASARYIPKVRTNNKGACVRLTPCHVFDLEGIYMRIYTMSSKKNDQSSSASEPAEEQRQIRLQRRRERERASRASETAEQREERLRKRRNRDRARRAAQSEEQRQALLKRERPGYGN